MSLFKDSGTIKSMLKYVKINRNTEGENNYL